MSLRIPRFTIQAPTPSNQKYWARMEMTNHIPGTLKIHGWQTDQEHPDLDQVRVVGRTNPGAVWLELARFATAPGYLSREEGGIADLQIHTSGRIKKIEPKDYTGIAA